jgi:ABC-type multidrug transport system fused ATPase/permease subunit
MSHGVHAVQHEAEHHMEHEHGHGGGLESRNKKIALLIAVIALFLAFSETLGKSAQTAALSYNVEASNLWAFFQAKTIRRTLVETIAQATTLQANAARDETIKAPMTKQIDFWQKTAARYRSEPETREGSVELAERAKDAEHKRDVAMAKYHHYEVASAAFQIGIVLASATVITGMLVLSFISAGLAVVGLGFMAIGLWAPHAVHLF